MNKLAYWTECLAYAAEEIGLALTEKQISSLASAVGEAHENIGMAFYSPPGSDRINALEEEWRSKLARLDRDFCRYTENAETAIKVALRQHPDTAVSIEDDGTVLRYGGRVEEIQ